MSEIARAMPRASPANTRSASGDISPGAPWPAAKADPVSPSPEARGLDARGIVHELRADALERADRLAELLPLERVAPRGFVRPLGETDGERRDADASRVEHLQRVDEPLPFQAERL